MGLFDKAVGKDEPRIPKYEELADTDWIARNRDLNSKTWTNLNRDWNNVNVLDDNVRQQLNAYNDSIYNRAEKDFDRSYGQTMNKYLARDYNRLGTTGGAQSLLTRDNYNLAQQRKLADLEYDRALNYENMVNNELNRRYKWLNQNLNSFNTSGQTTQANDVANWMIRNGNLDRQYQQDIQDYNNSWIHQLGQLAGTAGQALATGFGGPIGNALAGSVNNSLFGDYHQGGTFSMDSPFNNMYSTNNVLGQMGIMGSPWFRSLVGSDSSNQQGSLGPLSSKLGYNPDNYQGIDRRNWLGQSTLFGY